jgi:hypothetical protein
MNEEDKKVEFKDPIHDDIDETAELERKRKEVLNKELLIRDRKASSAIEKIEEGDRSTELAKKASYAGYSEQDVTNKQNDNTQYMMGARCRMTFINKSFNDVVPFFSKNLILVGGKTGEGKSTAVANIIREMISELHPVTKKKRRILVLTNEEKCEDVYNRVTCLIKGWKYTNHDRFTDNQVETFNKYIQLLSTGGMLTVIDDNYYGTTGTTTTLEGICQVFDNLIEKKEHYDAVLIDYYQNVTESRRNPMMNEYEVQAALARRLDRYKNAYPAPIVVLAQVAPPDAERSTPFKVRIEGRKLILNVSTCAIEMIRNVENSTTEWIIHKSRFNEGVGESVLTGYRDGRYVEYTPEFIEGVNKMIADRERRKMDKTIQTMGSGDPEEDK